QHTEGSEDQTEAKKVKKHKKKSKSSEDKTAPTPSIPPSTETLTKDKEDMPPGIILEETRQEMQEPPTADSHQQGPVPNLESANSCMGDENAKDQETGNAESPPKENPIPEINQEVEPVVEE
ncbi:hypothetical protein A2U01_0053339, partial [Trifolium medium]|nr:hypothetical protein [Trifolium medium]